MLDVRYFLGVIDVSLTILDDNEYVYLEKKNAPFFSVDRFCKECFQPCGEYQSKT